MVAKEINGQLYKAMQRIWSKRLGVSSAARKYKVKVSDLEEKLNEWKQRSSAKRDRVLVAACVLWQGAIISHMTKKYETHFRDIEIEMNDWRNKPKSREERINFATNYVQKGIITCHDAASVCNLEENDIQYHLDRHSN